MLILVVAADAAKRGAATELLVADKLREQADGLQPTIATAMERTATALRYRFRFTLDTMPR